MDKKQLAAIALIILMVASSIAFTVYYQNNQPQDNTESVPPIEQQTTTIAYAAENVEATVSELLPSMRIGALTTELDISKLDKLVYGFEGVRTVRSQFRQAGTTELGQGLVYIADISFNSTVDKTKILEYLRNQKEFSRVDAYFFALLTIPKTITVFSQNPDLNLSRKYTFSSTLIEALVEENAKPGETIKTRVSLNLSGSTASNINAIQMPPEQPSIEQNQAEIEAQIKELEPELSITASLDSSWLSDQNAFLKEFESIQGVKKAELSLGSDYNAEEAVSKPTSIVIILSLLSTETKTVKSEAEKILQKKQATFEALQPAIFLIEKLSDPETGKEYSLEEKNITALIKPEHKQGETVSLEIIYFVFGEQIISVQATEAD